MTLPLPLPEAGGGRCPHVEAADGPRRLRGPNACPRPGLDAGTAVGRNPDAAGPPS